MFATENILTIGHEKQIEICFTTGSSFGTILGAKRSHFLEEAHCDG